MKKTFSHIELVKFIMNQPDYLPVDMTNMYNTAGSCGCVLVHFGVAKGILRENDGVGMSDIHNVNSDDVNATYDLIKKILLLNKTTYGVIKRELK